jgi:glycosyltransferase involved in cell wall biosynthesis
MMRIGILSSHPIQYQAPWFRELSKLAEVEVFFAFQPNPAQQAAGFGGAFTWDVDLLSGYQHRFLKNRAVSASANRFAGCDTPEIADIIRQERFDAFIVCGWNLKTYWQAIRACRRQRIPVLVRGDSQLASPRSAAVRWAKQAVYPYLLKQLDGFLSVGQRNREYLRHYGVPAERIFFAPHFVDNNWFRAKARQALPERNLLRAKWNASPATLVALFVGKFIPKKRPLDFLSGVVRAREQGAEIVPVLVGSGELDAQLRRSAEQQGIPAIFEGFRNQSELPACYAASDVLVLPSDGGETWGLVVNEAMASGLPAIVSNAAGCAPDLIEDGATGFTFPIGDIELLAKRLGERRAISADRLNEALARKLTIYSVETCTQNTLSALAEITGAARGRADVVTVR